MKRTNYLTLFLLAVFSATGCKKQNPLILNVNLQRTCISKNIMQILPNKTKVILTVPGRTYDLLGLGWQQEHWQIRPRSWLPWISVNQMRGITGMEEFDPELYK